MRHHYAAHSTGCDLPPLLNSEGNITIPNAERNVVECPRLQMKRRYEWDIDPDDVRGPTIHGLRGTGILARFAEGFDAGQIANDIGATRQTVDHYMRFRDQMDVAAAGRARLRLIQTDG